MTRSTSSNQCSRIIMATLMLLSAAIIIQQLTEGSEIHLIRHAYTPAENGF